MFDLHSLHVLIVISSENVFLYYIWSAEHLNQRLNSQFQDFYLNLFPLQLMCVCLCVYLKNVMKKYLMNYKQTGGLTELYKMLKLVIQHNFLCFTSVSTHVCSQRWKIKYSVTVSADEAQYIAHFGFPCTQIYTRTYTHCTEGRSKHFMVETCRNLNTAALYHEVPFSHRK